ncbi:MAG: sensor histidine kinase, partial [Gaiellales bacterium]
VAFVALLARPAGPVGRAGARPAELDLRLAEQLISAEQDERRRLSILLHDGPLQSLSGIALMHDAALSALESGDVDAAASVTRRALERERDTLQAMRDLSFAIEPLVLRDQGFVSAVRALADQVERRGDVRVGLDGAVGEELAEKAQVALYQTIREALTQATRRHPKNVTVDVARQDDGSYLTLIADDGMIERRRRNVEAIEERARVLRGTVTVEAGNESGTIVRVVLPGYVAAAPEQQAKAVGTVATA